MLLWAVLMRCVEPIATIAACLSFKDPFVCPLHKQVFHCNISCFVSRLTQAQHAADAAKRRLAHSSMSDHLAVCVTHRVLRPYCV